MIVDHHIILISGLLGTESGDRNRKRYPQSWQGSLVRWNASCSRTIGSSRLSINNQSRLIESLLEDLALFVAGEFIILGVPARPVASCEPGPLP